MKVIVTALPGSGKTTIINMVKKKLPRVKVVVFGDIIAKIAEKKFGIKDRDELRKKLTIEQQRYLQEEVSRKVSEMKAQDILIDTHASIKTPSGYFPALSEITVHRIKPDVIVFLEYRPKDIIARRKKDKKRKRDNDTEKDILEYQEISEQFVAEAAEHAESAVKIIDLRFPEKKPFDHAKKAAEEIVKLFKK